MADSDKPIADRRDREVTPSGVTLTMGEDFAAMSLDARSWYFYRRQNKIYALINKIAGLDPDASEVPWADQILLADMLKDARDRKEKNSRKREARVTTATSVVRTVMGGVAAAGALKLIALLVTAWPLVSLTTAPHK
jgi:hypothetical protein